MIFMLTSLKLFQRSNIVIQLNLIPMLGVLSRSEALTQLLRPCCSLPPCQSFCLGSWAETLSGKISLQVSDLF